MNNIKKHSLTNLPNEVGNVLPKKFPPAVSQRFKSHNISLPDRVDFLLGLHGRSRNWLADQIGIGKGTLSKILNNLWKPSFRIKLLMAEKLSVDSLVLFGDARYFTDYEKTFKKVEVENE